LKLDTQGSDVEIAKSAGTSLTEFVGLQSEIAFQTIYEGTPDYLSALGFYQSAGVFISRIVPINQANFPEVVEMDVIMSKRRRENPSLKRPGDPVGPEHPCVLNQMLELGRPEYVCIAQPETRVELSAPTSPTHAIRRTTSAPQNGGVR
jgi:hypothetical protein